MTEIVTKGIADQLCDGSERLDEMERKIIMIVRILHGRFEAYRKSARPIAYMFDCSGWSPGERIWVNYQWEVYENYHLIIKCSRVTNVFLMSHTVEEAFVCINNRPTKSISMGDIKGIHDGLNEFVSAVLGKFPNMEHELRSLLIAGQ